MKFNSILLGKGKRFSVLHAGCRDGFIKGTLKVLVDDEFNSEKFESWLKEQLLPGLENKQKPCVIVYYNALTHSRYNFS